MALPLKVKPGDPIKASDWNTLIDHLRASQLLPSKGVRVTRTGMGTILSADIVAGKGGGGGATHPFQYYKSPYLGTPPEPASQEFKYRVRLGTVSNYAPMNIGNEFTLEPSKVTWAWVKANFAMHELSQYSVPQLVSCQIEQGAAIPAETLEDGSAPAASYWPLFRVTTDATKVTKVEPVTRGSLSVTPVPVGPSSITGATNTKLTMQYQWNGISDQFVGA